MNISTGLIGPAVTARRKTDGTSGDGRAVDDNAMSGSRLSSRLVLGAIAGLTATTAMTAVMRRLRQRLPGEERYPLPPREITERLLPISEENNLRDQSLMAHFSYGAVAGALIASTGTKRGDVAGAMLGAGIWAASYFGWVPTFGILKPANEHPAPRNALMIGAHLVWGAATTWSIRELAAARDTIMAEGALRDSAAAPGGRGASSEG